MIYLVAIFALAVGVADWWTTQRILDQGGRELNPIMAWLMVKLDDLWWAPKMALHTAIAAAVVLADHQVITGVAMVAMAANAAVVVNNWRQIRRPAGPS